MTKQLRNFEIISLYISSIYLFVIRPDHTLQDVRAKIFPFKRRKVKAPEVVAAVTIPVRRKERSLSSLVVSTPRVSNQTTLTGRRTKAVARKAAALRGPSFSVEKSIKKEEYSGDDHPESSSSPENLNKFPINIRQVKEVKCFHFFMLFLIYDLLGCRCGFPTNSSKRQICLFTYVMHAFVFDWCRALHLLSLATRFQIKKPKMFLNYGKGNWIFGNL